LTVQAPQLPRTLYGRAVELVPGLVLAGMIAGAAQLSAPYFGKLVPIPPIVIALVIGMALNPLAGHPTIKPGMAFCTRVVLRWAVALLGLRVALGDIAALGLLTCVLVIVAMIVTVVSGFAFARWSGRPDGFGALIGVGTAVCGASATLACATVVPDYRRKQADVAFVVVAVNALATLAMLSYPPLCIALGFDEHTAGIMLGGTIHDVAQVVGAGYALSEVAGNTAVIVKLFRVFLLFPTVLAVGWYFTRKGAKHGEARVPAPVFALMFLLLCGLNSALSYAPSLTPLYAPIKAAALAGSAWGLLFAIAALGLATSLKTLLELGWRQIAGAFAVTAVIFVIVTGGLLLLHLAA
jgi:uncharacterized integral membrane protein (TIGR00698 family)